MISFDLIKNYFQKFDFIDFCILNEIYKTNSSFGYEVITNYKMLYCRDENFFINFKTNCFLYYFDDEPIKKMVVEGFDLRMKTNKLGERNFVR